MRALRTLALTLAGSFAIAAPCVGAPTITTQPAAATTVAIGGTSPSISVSATGGQPVTYQWYRGSTALPGQTSQYLDFGSTAQPGDAGSYTVQVTDPTGTATSIAAVVTVTPSASPLAAVATETPSYATYPGENSISFTGPYLYQLGQVATQWYKDVQVIPGATSSIYQGPPVISSAANGAYVEVLGNSTAQAAAPPDYFFYNPAPPSTFWTGASAQGGIVYFAFNSTGQILRYDMSTGTWLAPVNLAAAPTAICALPEGVYVSEGRTTYLYSLDLSSSQGVVNTTAAGTQIFYNPTYVYLYCEENGGQPTVQSIDRSTLAAGASSSSAFSNGSVAIAAAPGFVIGWSDSDGSVLTMSALNPDGSLGGGSENFNISQEDPTNAATVITPNGLSFIAGTGNVYSVAATPAIEASLGLPITDACFLADGSPVALRTGQLTLYSTAYAEEGIVALPADAQRVFANGSTAFAFSASASAGGQPAVASVTEAQLAASPRGSLPGLSAAASAALGVMPDDGFVGSDGNLYLLSRVTGNILRWSPSSNGYLAAIPLSGVPLQMSYSSALNRIYLAYADQRVTQINLGSGTTESPFTVLQATPGPIAAADGQLLAYTNQIYSDLMCLFSSSGALETTQSGNPYESPFYWDSATQSLLTVNYGDLGVYTVGAGTFVGSQTYEAGQNPAVAGPLRISADGSLFSDANGIVYSTSTYADAGVLPASPVDAAWSGSTVYMISSVNGGTQVDECPGTSYLSSAHVELSGAPFRIWAVGGGDFAVMVGTPYGPEIYTINGSLSVMQSQANTGPWFGPPVITTEPVGAQVTAGGSATFSVVAIGSNPTYSWTSQYGGQVLGTGPTLTLSNITASMAGYYYVTVASNGNTVTSDPVGLVVLAPPTIIYGPSGGTVAQGQDLTLTVYASGQPPPTYQWYLDGSAIAGATLSIYTITSATSASAGTYSVEVSNANGTTTSQGASVTVSVPSQAPAITVQPQSQSVDTGVSATFSVTATGSPAPTYQWYLNSSPISGQTGSSITLGPVQASDAGSYTVTVSNSAGSVTSSAATLTISATVAPAITTQPLSQSLAPGSAATFTVSASGTGPLAYQWNFDNTPIAGAVSATYSIASARASNSGSYTVTVTGPDTSVVSQGAVLTVAGSSGAPAIGTQPQPQVIQAGGTVTFSVTSTGSLTASVAERASSSTSYQWLRNNVAISGATDSTLVLRDTTAADAGSYSCLIANNSGATVSGSAVLTVANSTAPGRLIDISCRALVGTGGNILIAGFTVGEGSAATLPVLVRSSGPALAQFNVTGLLPDPTLELYPASNTAAPLETNAGWSGGTIISSTAANVGAFAWTSTSSHDSAIVQSLGPGGYTAQTLGASGDTGVALAEVYDATPSGSYAAGISQRLTNISARVQVGTGSGVLIAGFVIGGNTSETVLIRASGPALTPFGVTGILPDPKLTLNGGSSATSVIAADQGWSGDAQSAAIAASVGAFAWPSTSSNDSLLLVTLPPGAYTAEVSGASGDTGVALVEVYEVP